VRALQQSLNQKRNSDSHVEVITSEDVGKMPDKNVADSLQRMPA
jgi:iron complex outermembrane receptor protein